MMANYEDAQEILKELMEEEEEKSFGLRERELFPQVEQDLLTLRRAVERLLPEEVQEWIEEVEQCSTYEEVPLPSFLEEVWNSNWQSSSISFAPTRRFEGEVTNGVKIWVELSYSTLIVKIDGAFLFGIALRG